MNLSEDFDDFVARARPILVSHCRRATRCNFEDAEDASQHALTQLLAKRNEIYATSEAEVIKWLKTTSVRFLKDGFRKRNREHALDEPEEILTASADDRSEITDEFWRVFEKLPPKQRMAFALHYLHKKTYSEIAHQMHVALGTAWNLVHDAKQRLRELLREYDPDEQRLAPDSALIRQRPERPLRAGRST